LEASEAEAMKYLIVIEKTRTGFSAYSPDLLGCVAAAKTRVAVRKLMREAIQFHLEGMREEGSRAPKPTSTSVYVEVPPLRSEKSIRHEFEISRRVRGVLGARFAERKHSEAAISRKRP
jgi:predicted RNase H-like HicB family nuclease